MTTYAVGDLQGCLKPLQCLLQQVDFDFERDRLWLTGDLINRGPDSLETLRFLYRHRDHITTVLGNHDLHFLAVYHGHARLHPSDTLDALLAAPDCAELAQWLQQQPLLHSDPHNGFHMVHAGIPPIWSLTQAQTYAREVEQQLQQQADNYFQHMYGNQPDCWSPDLAGPERWRTITNYFTRMRFCSAEGRLDFSNKLGAEQAQQQFQPWFDFEQRPSRQDKIIFGHWAALQGKTEADNVFALDTGCVWGGQLSFLRLQDQHYFRCDC